MLTSVYLSTSQRSVHELTTPTLSRLQPHQSRQGPARGEEGARHDWYLQLPALSFLQTCEQAGVIFIWGHRRGNYLSVSSGERS